MKIYQVTLITVAVTLFLISCNQGSKKQVTQPEEAKEVAEMDQNTDMLVVDTNQSVITWIGSKPTGQHNGTINIKEGTIGISESGIVGGKIIIDIQSLEDKDLEKDSENYQKLTGHLMSDDFFAAEQYPAASFEIVSVGPFDTAKVAEDKDEFDSEYAPAAMSEFIVDNPTHLVTGNLTMRGITKSITFPASVKIDESNVKAEAKFNIDRTDWNLSYGDEASVLDKAKDKFIYNTVNVGFSLTASKEDPS